MCSIFSKLFFHPITNKTVYRLGSRYFTEFWHKNKVPEMGHQYPDQTEQHLHLFFYKKRTSSIFKSGT